MERTQISLEPAQADLLRRLARERGMSMAHLIRDAVERSYGTALAPPTLPERLERAMSAVGCASSGLGDLAVDHDRYLDEAFGS